jgi:hypothetical protein
MNAGKETIQSWIIGILNRPENKFLKSEYNEFMEEY